jgi:hypothetical protein
VQDHAYAQRLGNAWAYYYGRQPTMTMQGMLALVYAQTVDGSCYVLRAADRRVLSGSEHACLSREGVLSRVIRGSPSDCMGVAVLYLVGQGSCPHLNILQR